MSRPDEGVARSMASRRFSVTWDYRCPFARNGHEHVLAGLDAGAPWEVTFVPFFLNQAHVAEGGTPAWEDPAAQPDLVALAAGVVARDRLPEQFRAVHLALFAARHDQGRDLRDHAVVADALTGPVWTPRRFSARWTPAGRPRSYATSTSGPSRNSGSSACRRSWSATGPCSCASWTVRRATEAGVVTASNGCST